MTRQRLHANFNIALHALLTNKLRSVLTALGIIFGVAAVIAMLSIGNGTEQKIISQMKLVGANNIIIDPVIEAHQEEEKVQDNRANKQNKFSPGLNLQDANSIKKIIPNAEEVSPEILMETNVIRDGLTQKTRVVGIEPAYFRLANFDLASGKMFSEVHLTKGMPVCIIGQNIKSTFFSKQDPIGSKIKCGSQWLKVIGVLKRRNISSQNLENLSIRNYNDEIYIPIKTALIRYKNRNRLTEAMLKAANQEQNSNQEQNQESTGEKEQENYHQLDRMVVRINKTELLEPSSEVIANMLQRRHNQVNDFTITIPELLIKQQRETKQVFNIVLGAIAGISLVVGGIGIMNIMLASVMERIKEIGIRLAIGARKSDIIAQFLLEAVMISISGGLLGVVLGIIMANIIAGIAQIPTVITFFSVFLSFMVAASVGLIFGIAPARTAANKDPITSLRHE